MQPGQLTATERTFATAELLEVILLKYLDHVQDIDDQEDPRSPRTHRNAEILQGLLHCSRVNRSWYQALQDSGRLRRALYLDPDHLTTRSWTHYPRVKKSDAGNTLDPPTTATSTTQEDPHQRSRQVTPLLNPIIQTTFPSFMFRFWHLSPEHSGNKFCAYLIITKRDSIALNREARKCNGQGRTLARMLLSQPPCTGLEATIWEERDETKDYTGRTCELAEPVVRRQEGLRLEIVLEWVGALFGRYPDLTAIKLTTL
ncbi:hypothetical protein MBLNU230_g0340t1 [Neophaeotheca triangularis]